MHRQDRLALFALGAGLTIANGLHVACTPAQRAEAKTALEVNRCVTTISLRHIDAGDDFSDPLVLARISAEHVDECGPLLAPKD